MGGIALVLAIGGCNSDSSVVDPAPAAEPPNILFVVLDDVGMDQMEIFGFGGGTPPGTPNIAEIAGAGVSFTDTWSMPACSPTRGVMYEGRFPLRTNVKAALGPNDLANSMTSPYAMTISKLLATRGYESALIGKFHIALPDMNPAGNAVVHDLGWNYFAGWLDETGDPPSIDTTAGGVAPPGTYSCGFVPGGHMANGADAGACYLPDGSCSVPAGGPCVIGSCTQIPNVRSVCEDNNGVWWGEDNDAEVNGIPAPAEGFQYCSQVREFVERNGGDSFFIQPLVSIAVRNEGFKLVENTFKDCESSAGSCVDETVTELYEIDVPLNTPWIDWEDTNLPLDALSDEQQAAYDELAGQLAALRATVVACPGDGNIDGVVDAKDLQDWERFAESWGLSSVYDLNLDGRTDTLDRDIILENLGLDCRGGGA